jgi:hypothetical protein
LAARQPEGKFDDECAAADAEDHIQGDARSAGPDVRGEAQREVDRDASQGQRRDHVFTANGERASSRGAIGRCHDAAGMVCRASKSRP